MPVQPSFDDTRDFRDADRGFIAALTPGVIKNDDGSVVWDIDAFNFLKEECPATAHPHLWRQGQLNAKQGLFEVALGIYQVRALDLSNMTIVEGREGIIIIDPLISCECAAAGLRLYREHRGAVDPAAKTRRVTGIIYSHSHDDHYMGAGGIVDANDHSYPIIAPEGFMEAVMSESIVAGPAMRRRGAYMYGSALPYSPTGQIGTGLGMGTSTGTTSLVPPTLLIQRTGEEHTIDGVRIVFQMVPGSEAPAEINFWFPDLRALCIPETATNCMHNIITLRGALVRDAKLWAGYLDEAIVRFGAGSDVMFGSHNWPSWGTDELVTRLSEQRDMYGYLHDQTVRLMNLGMTGIEIAEIMEEQMPPAIARAWHCRGFYGSVSHNVKGIYQKYMTWFDGDPAHLWQYPPAAEGARYVECFGGVEPLCEKARIFMNRGDDRFAVTLLAHAVAADTNEDPKNPARTLLADCYEKLGFGAENATWRNFYLTSAQRLRTGKQPGTVVGGTTLLGPNLSVERWFEILAVHLDGVRASVREKAFTIDFAITDVVADKTSAAQTWRLLISNGVLTPRLLFEDADKADFSMTLTRAQLLDVLRGKDVQVAKEEGDKAILNEFLDLISKTLFASGGVTNGDQALKLLNAGASVAMVYTGLVYGGAGTITRIKEEMREKVAAAKKPEPKVVQAIEAKAIEAKAGEAKAGEAKPVVNAVKEKVTDLTMNRWWFWKKRFEELGSASDAGFQSDKVREEALRAARYMDEIVARMAESLYGSWEPMMMIM